MTNENFNKFCNRVEKKIRFKIIVLFFLIFELLYVIILLITQIPFIQNNFSSINAYINFAIYLFIPITLILISIYDKYNPEKKLNDIELIEYYIRFLGSNNISDYFYSETIVWFAKESRKFYNQKQIYEDKYNPILEINNLLYPALRYTEKSNGIFLAFYHKSTFTDLCKNLSEQLDSNVNLLDLQKTIGCFFETINTEEPTNPKFFSINFDKNLKSILTYSILILIHLLACCLPIWGSNTEKTFDFQSFLFYIPQDILLILVFKKIISTQQENDSI